MNYFVNEDLAEETGIHAGDGSMNVYKNNGSLYTVACHKDDDREYMDNVILPLIKKIYGKTPKPRNWSQGTYGFRICSKSIIEFKNQTLGLPLGKKDNIRIPEIIYNDKKLILPFLRGLFDTDGSVYIWSRANRRTQLYPRIYFSSISKILVWQVREALIKAGFRVSYCEIVSKKPNEQNVYRLALNGVEMTTKWVEEIGFHNPKNIKKLLSIGIKHKIL
ncbi:MAG TPA: LAGLIDADG family homing endonuclease [Candidatus Nanoarchaeia archaeon]|nr:LAGLIDADG family homing endonuclease [Candidatus Nanoarchaeia archaeon]